MGWPIGWCSLEPLPAEAIEEWRQAQAAGTWWQEEPAGLSRTVTELENRVSQLRVLGNGQVPAAAGAAWVLLTNED